MCPADGSTLPRKPFVDISYHSRNNRPKPPGHWDGTPLYSFSELSVTDVLKLDSLKRINATDEFKPTRKIVRQAKDKPNLVDRIFVPVVGINSLIDD